MKIVDLQPTKKERDALNQIQDRFEKMRTERSKYEKDWKEAEKQREMTYGDKPKDDWRSDLHLPDTFSIIETAKAEMVAQSPSITYFPRESGDVDKAQKHNHIFEYTWEKGNGDLQLINFMDDALVYGLAIGEEYWRKDIINEKYIEDFDIKEMMPTKWKQNERTTFDDVYFETLPIWAFYWDPKADSLENAKDVCKVLHYYKDDFWQKFKKFPGTKKVISSGGALSMAKGYKPVGELKDDEVEVKFYYNKLDDLYLIAADGILITDPDNPNPYKHKDFPFIRGVDIILPHKFVGMGEPKVMKYLLDERQTLRNMRLDATHLNIQTQYIVDDRLELDDEDLIAKPHGIIRGPLDSIRAIDKIPVFAESYKEEEFINDDIIKATGIDIRMQSVSGQQDTATEVAILKESSLKRIRLKLKLLEKMSLHRLGRLRLANVQQFYSMPRVSKILGESGKIEEVDQYKEIGFKHPRGTYEYFTAMPDDLTGEYDIIVVPGATLPVSKALEAQKRINLYDRLNGKPTINQIELDKMLIEAHDENPDKLLAQEQPMGQGMPPGMEQMAGIMGQPQGGMPPAMPPVGVNRSAPTPPVEGRIASGNVK